MSLPRCAVWSKPQKVMESARNCFGPTGQPSCQLLPSEAAVTCRLCQLNGGRVAAACAAAARILAAFTARSRAVRAAARTPSGMAVGDDATALGDKDPDSAAVLPL